MKESYNLISANIKKDQIEEATIEICFQKNNKRALISVSKKLMASIDKDSSKDIIIHCVLNAIGSGNLRKLRKEWESKLSSEEKL